MVHRCSVHAATTYAHLLDPASRPEPSASGATSPGSSPTTRYRAGLHELGALPRGATGKADKALLRTEAAARAGNAH